jgi:hypothetical protein
MVRSSPAIIVNYGYRRDRAIRLCCRPLFAIVIILRMVSEVKLLFERGNYLSVLFLFKVTDDVGISGSPNLSLCIIKALHNTHITHKNGNPGDPS